MDNIMKDVKRMPGFGDWLKASGVNGDMDDRMKAQLQETWKLLDKMARDDPAKYKAFVDRQMKEARDETEQSRRAKELDITPHFMLVCTSQGSLPQIQVARNRHVAPPDLEEGHTVYANVCSHDLLRNPILPSEKAPTTARPSDVPLETLFSLNIDMALSPARRIDGQPSGSKRGKGSWAVDVLVPEWVCQAAKARAQFHPEFCKFIVSCVSEELGVQLSPPRVGDTGKYQGGSGPGGQTPQPFKREWIPLQDVAKKGAADNRSHAPLDSMSGLLGALSQSHAQPDMLSSEASGLDGLLRIGEQLTALQGGTDATQQSQRSDPAEQLASTVAGSLPLDMQLYPGAADVSVEHTLDGFAVTVRLMSDQVELQQLRMADAQLEVEPTQMTFRIPRQLLRRYQGLEVPQVLIALAAFSKPVDPDSVQAKWNKKEGVLRVNMVAVVQ